MHQLIVSAAEWDAFLTAFATHHLPGDAVMPVSGPRLYPCLVALAVVAGEAGKPKVLACYTYVEDARRLLAAAPPAGAAAPAAAPVPGRTQQDFNVSVSANLVAIVRFLVTTGICTEERYEREYAAQLDRNMQARQEDLNALIAKAARGQ